MSFGKTGIKSNSESRGSLSEGGHPLWFFLSHGFWYNTKISTYTRAWLFRSKRLLIYDSPKRLGKFLSESVVNNFLTNDFTVTVSGICLFSTYWKDHEKQSLIK